MATNGTNGNGNGNGNGEIAKARLDRRLVIYPPLVVILGLFIYGFVGGGDALRERILSLLGSSLDLIVISALASKALGALGGLRVGSFQIGAPPEPKPPEQPKG